MTHAVAAATLDQALADYTHLHRHPELSFAEEQTARYIEARLDALGIEHFRCAGTGVVGLQRRGDGPVAAFRADIDGLPIAEATGLPYASTATGTAPDGAVVPVMHGCGHDSHTACALAAAGELASGRHAWAGTAVWVFQPAEETAQGALAMVADGLWERAPHPAVVFGQHIGTFPAGRVRLADGPACAMADSWRIRVRGRQAHASRPHTGIDPIVQACATVLRLQALVAREVSAQDSAVVTVGTFHAGLKENIMPETAEFTVNVRTVDPAVRDLVLAGIRRIVAAEAAASAAPEPEIEVIHSFPALVNDPAATAALWDAFAAQFGAALEPGALSMGSEDFGGLAAALGVPNVFWRYGSLSPADAARQAAGEPVPSNHSPGFAPDPGPSLATGTAAALTALLSRLGA